MNNSIVPPSSSLSIGCLSDADFKLSEDDKYKLQALTVPIPRNESR